MASGAPDELSPAHLTSVHDTAQSERLQCKRVLALWWYVAAPRSAAVAAGDDPPSGESEAETRVPREPLSRAATSVWP